MENQHRKITGYRELSADEIEVMNAIKEIAANVGGMIDASEKAEGIDQRALSIARTHLQSGFMWFTRAVARPDSF